MIARVHLRSISVLNSKSCGIMTAYRPTGSLPRRGPLLPNVYERQAKLELSESVIKKCESTVV